MNHFKQLIAAAVSLSLCVGTYASYPTIAILKESQELNPSGVAPLTGVINIKLDVPVKVDITVLDKNGADNLTHSFGEMSANHRVPVLGLYPDHSNTVQVTFRDAADEVLAFKKYVFETAPLIDDMPEIKIDVAKKDKMVPGWTFVSYFGRSKARKEKKQWLPYQPFMMDEDGNIRWYLSFIGHPEFGNLNYGNGMERLANGNLYFGHKKTNKIYEIDMLGHLVNEWEMPGHGFHHHVEEKPNGNFVVSTSLLEADTVEDYMIEIDRQSGEIIRVWDFNQSFEYGRRKPFENVGITLDEPDVDWFHVNGVAYDWLKKDGVIVSARTQALAKVSNDNKAVWIMSPHIEWGRAGDGEDMNDYLLTPLDASGAPITDADVLNGLKKHPDFEWPWYMHAPQLLPNGNILLFDNGNNRHFLGNDTDVENYSRVVEYKVDEDAMTVQQVWQYGKERGAEFFSQVVSDADYFPEHNRVFGSFGSVKVGEDNFYGKIVEVDYDTKEVIFEATVTPPLPFFVVTFHRSERMPIYPPTQ